jgi:hypothetical protein
MSLRERQVLKTSLKCHVIYHLKLANPIAIGIALKLSHAFRCLKRLCTSRYETAAGLTQQKLSNRLSLFIGSEWSIHPETFPKCLMFLR